MMEQYEGNVKMKSIAIGTICPLNAMLLKQLRLILRIITIKLKKQIMII